MHKYSLQIIAAITDTDEREKTTQTLTQYGHRVASAENGKIALELFDKNKPDLVLLDCELPVVDGFEVCERIKTAVVGQDVPVLFLPERMEQGLLAQCLACGGDDFLLKPLNCFVLRAKIDVLTRIRDRCHTAHQKLKHVSKQLNHAQLEFEAAERLLAKLTSHGRSVPENIRYLGSPKFFNSGDILLTAEPRHMVQYVLLGDFTGHGLPAALGTIPVHEVFCGMSQKNLPLPAILREINQKIFHRLPTGVFMAAAALQVDHLQGEISVCNGGLPDVLILRADGNQVVRHESNQMPLGVVEDIDFEASFKTYPLDCNDKVIFFTDGVTDQSNSSNHRLGTERIMGTIAACSTFKNAFDTLGREIFEFGAGRLQHDDLTIVELSRLPLPSTFRSENASVAHAK